MSAITNVMAEGGSFDNLGLGSLVIHVPQGAAQFRVAHVAADLPHAHWRATGGQREIVLPWVCGGHQKFHPVSAVIEFNTGEISTATEGNFRRSGVPAWPARALNSPPGFIMRGTGLSEPVWPLHHYCDFTPYPQGNNFKGLLWHEDGYAWVTSNTWGIDIGETPDDVIMVRMTARQFDISANHVNMNASGVTIRFQLSSPDLDLKGGYLCLGMVTSFPDGRRGRYHLRRPITFGAAGQFPEHVINLPSGSHPDWVCSFGANGVPLNQMPAGPDIRFVEELNLIARDWSTPPTGQLRVREFSARP